MSVRELLDKLERLRNIMIQRAVGGTVDGEEYVSLRADVVADEALRERLPRCVRTCRMIEDFWSFIKGEYVHYEERRQFLREQFEPALTYLEDQSRLQTSPPDLSQSFSKRHGLVEDVEIAVREDAPESFRVGLLTILHDDLRISPRELRAIVCGLLRQRPNESNWSEYPNIWDEVQYRVYGCEWYHVYDLIEAVCEWLPRHSRSSQTKEFASKVNRLMEEEGIGWQMVDGKVNTRGSAPFEATVSDATERLSVSPFTVANMELREARRDFSRRPEPDLSGAVHHAWAALEAVAREICEDRKATLGDLIKRYPGLFPRPVDDAVAKLWGYASENARHGREERSLAQEEVALVVGVAAILASYLIDKHPGSDP